MLTQRLLRAGLAGAALYASWLGLAACSSDDSDTGGERVTLQFEVRAAPAALEPFENDIGWTITLTRGAVSFGPLYLYEGAPVARQQQWLGIRAAHAHPGHYESGRALGEWLEPTSVDLLGGATELGAGSGVTGEALSASFYFHAPPTGPASGELGAHAIVLEGSASREGEQLDFRVSAGLTDVSDDGSGEIPGCRLTGGTIAGDARVVVELDPTLWLDQVDFADVPSTDGTRSELEPGGRAHEAFVRGLRKAAGYHFEMIANQ